MNWLIYFGETFLVSLIASKLVILLGRKLGIIDDPKRHKLAKVVHTSPVPRGGGIPIFLALLVFSFMVGLNKQLIGILLGLTVLAITGFIDDKYEEMVSPYLRLILNGLAALFVIGSGIGIAYITNPFGGTIDLSVLKSCWGGHCVWWLSDIFALIWLVGMQNFVGWSSGIDGQMPGFVVVAAIAMGALGMRFEDASQGMVVLLAWATAGAYLGFLFWNWYPQKIMPGYGGKSMAGLLLGTLAILSGAKVGAMMMILSMPLIDAIWVILKRIKTGRSPVWGGADHLHHALLAKGWGKRRISVFYWSVSAAMGILAWQLHPPLKLFTMAAAGLAIGGIVLWIHYFSTYSKQHGPDSG